MNLIPQMGIIQPTQNLFEGDRYEPVLKTGNDPNRDNFYHRHWTGMADGK